MELSTPKMSHDEMIETLKGLVFGTFDRTTPKEREALDMAIKTLEQEPILDKIRAEIHNGTHHFLDGEPIIEIKEVLQILDKYKAESEVEDGTN